MYPTTCLSSELTTRLMTFRNGGRTEGEWLARPGEGPSLINYLGRAVATQLALPVLIVSSAVESVAFTALLVVAKVGFKVGLPGISAARVYRVLKLWQSSKFTLVWNVGNFLVFNLFCKHVFTDESVTRYSFDREYQWDRSLVYRRIISTVMFIGGVGFLGMQTSGLVQQLDSAIESLLNWSCVAFSQIRIIEGIAFASLAILGSTLWGLPYIAVSVLCGIGPLNVRALRYEDIDYIQESWLPRYPVAGPHLIAPTDLLRRVNRNDPPINLFQNGPWRLQRNGEMLWVGTQGDLNQGITFFKECILSDDVDVKTQQDIRECDPEAYPFVLTRTVYHYVCGLKKDAPLPIFLKPVTQNKIAEIRARYREQIDSNQIDLKDRMKSIDFCKRGATSSPLPLNEAVFRDIQEVGLGELRTGVFITECWVVPPAAAVQNLA